MRCAAQTGLPSRCKNRRIVYCDFLPHCCMLASQTQNMNRDPHTRSDTPANTTMTGIYLIHDIEAVKQFEVLCQESLAASKMRRPALLLNLSVRTKYMTDSKSKAMNGFFARKLLLPLSRATPSVDDARDEAKHAGDGSCNETVTTASSPPARLHKGLVYLVRQWEIRDHYIFDGRRVDNNTLSVYCCLNARDQVRALHDLYKKVMDGLITQSELPRAIDSDLYSHFHTSQHDKTWIEIDVDTKDVSIIKRFIAYCPEMLSQSHFIVETRGGYHFVYQKDKFPRDIYKVTSLSEFRYTESARDGKPVQKQYFDIRSDVCLPVPGTTQGGFYTRFASKDRFQQ